jgi:hypothetical protein
MIIIRPNFASADNGIGRSFTDLLADDATIDRYAGRSSVDVMESILLSIVSQSVRVSHPVRWMASTRLTDLTRLT